MQIISIDWGLEKAGNEVIGSYVSVETDKPFEERVFHLESPPRLVLDLPGGELGDHPATVPVDDPLIKEIRVGQFQPDILRVVIDLVVNRPFCISYPQESKIRFSMEYGSLPQQPQPSVGKVALDPGHGGSSSGAVGPDGQPEKDINLAVALQAEKMLKQHGIEVILTRSGDRTASLNSRASIVNKADCDLIVSIHCNSFFHPSAHGTETYHYPGSDRGRKLASNLQERLVAELGRRNRGVKDANFYMLRETVPPAALVELAFISNPTEVKLLMDPNFQQKAARAVTDGIIAFLNE